MSQFVVGLTGGIGSGKSTVANIFQTQWKIDIVDADIIARQVVEPGTVALEQIVKKFGDDIIDNSGQLKRTKLREIVFTQPQAKTWLDQLLHPIIRQHMSSACQTAQSPYCLLVVPLLLENNLHSMADRILVTDCWPQTQLSRAVNRDNNSPQLILSIMNKQISRQSRLAAADDVVNTELARQSVEQQCKILHQQYLELAKLKALR
ncbi:dephospho-CoA kinase [Catenovulum agarivorans DS-2]|uniref:Dephospho-CoA kinase n=1 Tax=Catenovulum agarivorans DS-2 TaxID=1328313 RepID=W7QQ61_9ALTE|nr:dephospho-CoA kinase [Catenovulum agarivorans]EWH10043.1 dephospho-CoA kinase [Catenovulum agarivorans DS-2]